MARAFRIFARRRGLRFQIQGDGVPRTLSLCAAQVVSLGRDDACEVRLPAPGVSRRHLSIFENRGQLFVRDHSAHGTRVDGQALRLAVRRFVPPALLEVGPYRIWVSVLGPHQRINEWLIRRAKRLAGRRSIAALSVLAGLAALITSAARRPPALPPRAVAECGSTTGASDEALLADAGPLAEVPSARTAALLLRAGRRREAWFAYRALSADPHSQAPFGVVAGILEYEMSCGR